MPDLSGVMLIAILLRSFVIALLEAGGGWSTVSIFIWLARSSVLVAESCVILFLCPQFSKVVNVGFISSAWSAATSDIYISSR